MPSGLSQSHQEIAGQFQWELLQLTCLGSGGQHVQRPPPRGMGRPIGLQCPCNSFTRQEVRGASDSTNQRIENNALVSSSGITGGARRVVYLVVSYSPVRGSAKDTRLRIHLDRQVDVVLWCSPVPAPSTDTRADPASARRAAGPARGRVGRAGGPLWCGPSLGAGAFWRPFPSFSRPCL